MHSNCIGSFIPILLGLSFHPCIILNQTRKGQNKRSRSIIEQQSVERRNIQSWIQNLGSVLYHCLYISFWNDCRRICAYWQACPRTQPSPNPVKPRSQSVPRGLGLTLRSKIITYNYTRSLFLWQMTEKWVGFLV